MIRFALGLMIAAGLLLVVGHGHAQKKTGKKSAVVQEIKLKGLNLGGKKFGGSALKPKEISTKEELAKAVSTEKAYRKILSQVDFKKQKVLYFKWSGSGQDKISYQVKMGKGRPVVVFHYKRGLTRDLRLHRKMYAIAENAKWTVKKAPFKFKKRN